MSFGVKCPKCGMTQLPGPTCKSCGTALGGPPRRPVPPQPSSGTPGPPRPAAGVPAPPRPVPVEGEGAVRLAPPPAAKEGTYRIAFRGSGGSLFGIYGITSLLTIVTLGVYSFWAKVKVRRYLFSETEFEGDRFAFHGTGMELFLGTLKAFGVFLLPIILLSVLPDLLGLPSVVGAVASFLVWLLFITFLPVATVGARRYRLSRTSWRGIRFSFRGGVWDFMKLFWTGGLLSSITLGLYYPFFETRQQAYFVENTRFGTQRFSFDGKGRDLFWGFFFAVPLLPFTLGLSGIWYLAKKRRYYWEHTHVGEASFRFPITWGKLLGLYTVNLLLLVPTFGLAWPWVVVRNARFTCEHLRLEGPLNLEAITQDALSASTTGEGLAGLLDTDFGVGV